MAKLNNILKDYFTPSLLIGAIIGGAVYFGELKGLVFQSEEQRIKTKQHINTPINEVTVFRQNDTLLKRQDSLKVQQRELDSLLVRQNRLLDSIKQDNKKKYIKDSIDQIEKQKSRNAREYKMDLILEEISKLKDTAN